jgi:hypothetical protein
VSKVAGRLKYRLVDGGKKIEVTLWRRLPPELEDKE